MRHLVVHTEKQGKRDRETDTVTDTDTDSQTDRQTHAQTDIHYAHRHDKLRDNVPSHTP